MPTEIEFYNHGKRKNQNKVKDTSYISSIVLL